MNRKIISRIIIAFFLLVPFSLFISSLVMKKHHITQSYLQSGSILPEPKKLPAFELTDMNAHTFNNEQLKGHWSLVFFGFTRCPGVCPTSLAQLVQAQKLFTPGISLPQIVFVSVDPDYDSASVIKNYLAKFNPQFVGLTGAASQIEILSQALGVMYNKVATPQNYTMNHSDLILVINPEAEWVAVLTPPHRAEQIANDLAVIQSKSE